jgi:cytoskeletal protein RodZ
MAFKWRKRSASSSTVLTLGDEFAPSQEQPDRGWLKTEMATSIGEKLRLARETRGIALRDISDQTRISMRYLAAIETDDYRHLPGGIFNRSFIRAYAKHIGYDEQQALEEYSAMMHERGESTAEGPAKPHRFLVYTDDGNQSRSTLMTILLAVIILAVLSACAWAAWYFYEHKVRHKVQASSYAIQTAAVDRKLITIQSRITTAYAQAMELQISREDANELFA